MKVVYDISVLGLSFQHPRARTGIFRVVNNLAVELVRRQAIDFFSSSYSVRNYFVCLDYLKSNPELNGVCLLEPDLGKNLLSLFALNYELIRKNKIPIWCESWVNKIVNNIDKRIFCSRTVNFNKLDMAGLYHSPFYPIPEQIKNNKKLKKIITIYDLISVLFPDLFQFREDVLMQNILKSIDGDTWVTCISQATKDDLCNYLPNLDRSKVFVTHLAASEMFYLCGDTNLLQDVREKYNIPEGSYVLSLSTLEPRKNISQTIRCFSRMVKEQSIKDLSLVLVGAKGWDFDDIFNEIDASTEVRDRIIVTGYVSDLDLAPLYSGAMMFVYPSLYEGFGLPPLEAMQCGVPVITSNTSSLPEVVGNAGLMVDPKNVDDLCQAMLNIYLSSNLRNKMIADSLEQAKKFSWENTADQTVSVYKKAIGY